MIKVKGRRLLSSALIVTMLVTMCSSAYASSGTSVVALSAAGSNPEILSIQVPAEIPLSMDYEGTVTTPDNLKITNNSDTEIKVSGIVANGLDGWEPVSYSDDFTLKADDTKEFAFALNGDEMGSDGVFELTQDAWLIGTSSSLDLEIDAKIPMQTVASDSQIASIEFSFEAIVDEVVITCPECGAEVATVTEHVLDCDHYSCDTTITDHNYADCGVEGHYNCDGIDHDLADCNLDGHYNCDNLDHITCEYCGEYTCEGEHGDGICTVAAATTLDVEYTNGLMLPGSTNTATFNWTTNVENNSIVSLTSSNPDVADVQAVSNLTIGDEVSDEQEVVVNATARGTTTITGTLASGESESFVVDVSELQATTGENAPRAVIEDVDTLEAGDTLSTEDITITIPILDSEGTEVEVTATPDSMADVELVEGDNEIIATVNANGVTINITINIYITPAIDPATVVKEISVKTNPDKTSYTVGEDFDSEGLEITVTYEDGHTVDITSGFIVSGGEDLQLETESVTITFGDKTCSVDIEVNEPREITVEDLFDISDSGEILGFSDTYHNMTDKPTEIVVPATIGGITVTSVADDAFNNENDTTFFDFTNTAIAEWKGRYWFAGCTATITSKINCPDVVVNMAGTGHSLVDSSNSNDGYLLIIINSQNLIQQEFTVTATNRADIGYTGEDAELVIPSTFVKGNILYTVVDIGQDAFTNCSELYSITLPSSYSGETLYVQAFIGCGEPTKVYMPSDATWGGAMDELPDGAFMNIDTYDNGIVLIFDWP